MKNDQQGFGAGLLMILIAIMIFGYIVISRAINSQQAQDTKEQATELIDKTEDAADKANEALEATEKRLAP